MLTAIALALLFALLIYTLFVSAGYADKKIEEMDKEGKKQ